MGFAILVFSIVALFAFSGPMIMGSRQSMESGGIRSVVMRPVVEPPARKSVMVDTDGMERRTADNTQMTKRDRARVSRPVLVTAPEPAITPTPEPVVVSEPVTIAPAAEVPGVEATEIKPTPEAASSYQYVEGRTIPQAVYQNVVTEPSVSDRIEAELASDPLLSESARLTVRASYREGLVVLQGVASDDTEKEYLAVKAREFPGVTAVENRLHTLSEYATPLPAGAK